MDPVSELIAKYTRTYENTQTKMSIFNVTEHGIAKNASAALKNFITQIARTNSRQHKLSPASDSNHSQSLTQPRH